MDDTNILQTTDTTTATTTTIRQRRVRKRKKLSLLAGSCWFKRTVRFRVENICIVPLFIAVILMTNVWPSSSSSPFPASASSTSTGIYNNGFQLHSEPGIEGLTSNNNGSSESGTHAPVAAGMSCTNGLLTFELSTGFIYKPSSAETLAMMPSTLQLTDCLDYCLHNVSCLAINFEMGLCVLLSSSAKQNPQNLYSSQFPVFTIYAEKKCLLQGDTQAIKQKHRCQRAWTFERVAGYEMKTRPRRRLKFANKEHCMEACLLERDFECRSANWYRQTNECTLSDQDRHSVSQSEASDQQIKASLHELYGPSNLTSGARPSASARPTPPPGLYQNYYVPSSMGDRLRTIANKNESMLNETLMQQPVAKPARRRKRSSDDATVDLANPKHRRFRQLFSDMQRLRAGGAPTMSGAQHVAGSQRATTSAASGGGEPAIGPDLGGWPPAQYVVVELPANAPVDYLENNCVYEPNKLCEFRKIQNRVLKTVDSIYQDVNSLEECKQKCLNAPYRCYSFDYGDTSERVCRTSHLDQASLLSVKEPYLDVVGAITYELASCFNVSIQCRAREMVAQVSSSKMFRGKIYVKSRPNTCLNDVRESLQFELTMRYHDENCDVRATSTSQQGVFSNDIVIQHHDRIVTTQDVGLSVYCQYDLGNRSITNNVDLAIDRIDEAPFESKTHPAGGRPQAGNLASESGSLSSPLTITSLATTVVKSPNVTMRITNMNGQPVGSATVGDRLALLFEIKEKTSPFGIFVREIIAMDGKQLLSAAAAAAAANNGKPAGGYHYGNSTSSLLNEKTVESMFQANKANSVQFIDSDGCPTDANIMGPLIRMDPAGHRVLAPFDAFKFPTSDMVFFRAVVTSCVSECRPVVCQSANGLGGGGPLDESLNYITSTTAAALTGTTSSSASPGGSSSDHSTSDRHFSAESELPAASRNIPQQQQQQQPQQVSPLPSSYSAAPATPQLPEMRATTPTPIGAGVGHRHWPAGSTTAAAAAAAAGEPPLLPARLKPGGQPAGEPRGTTPFGNGSSGDSLTTIPGYGVPEQTVWQQDHQQQPAATQEPVAANVTTANNNSNSQQHANNNKTTRPVAAATTANSESLNVNNSNNSNSNKLAPIINLDTLAAQRQQIVKLFETKLKQQLAPNGQLLHNSNNNNYNGQQHSPNISEIADLFLNSIMSNGIAAGAAGGMNGGYNLPGAEDNNYTKRHEASIIRDVTSARGDTTSDNTATSGRLAEFETLNGNSVAAAANEDARASFVFGGSNNGGGERIADNIQSSVNQKATASTAKLINPLEQQQQQHLKITKPQSILEQEAGSPSVGDAATIVHHESAAAAAADDIEQPLDIQGNSDTVNYDNNGSDLSSSDAGLQNRLIQSVSPVGGGQQLQQQMLADVAQQNFDKISNAGSPLMVPTWRNRSQQPMKQQQSTDLLAMASSEEQQAVSSKPASVAKLAPIGRLPATQPDTGRHLKRHPDSKQANLQALADSYFGAYHSHGKRRKRRQIDETDDDDNDWPKSGVYMFVRQPQEAVYEAAPSTGLGRHFQAKFTDGFIEIYRASEGPPARSSSRRKREAEPSYDVDELVVQSIKITDRLQFQDEPTTTSGGGRNSRTNRGLASKQNQQQLPRNQLITRAQVGGNQTRSAAAAFGMDPVGLGFGGDDDGSFGAGYSGHQTSGWSSSGALSLVIVAASFIFVQIFLVLVCLVEFNQRRAAAKARNLRLSHPAAAVGYTQQVANNNFSRRGSVSTLSSGHGGTLCLDTSGGGGESLMSTNTTSSPQSNNHLMMQSPPSAIYSSSSAAIDCDLPTLCRDHLFEPPATTQTSGGRISGRRDIDLAQLSPTGAAIGGRKLAPTLLRGHCWLANNSWGSPIERPDMDSQSGCATTLARFHDRFAANCRQPNDSYTNGNSNLYEWTKHN